MSFTLELAASWARSPVKAVRNRRRFIQKSPDEDEANRSPTRVMDFPVEDAIDENLIDDEGEATTAFSMTDRKSIVRQLSFGPYDVDAPQDITPIPPFQRRRSTKVKILPTLLEDQKVESFAPTSVTTLIKIKKKSYLPKPSRSEKVQELITEAQGYAGVGEEDEAITVYEKAIRMAESELTKLKGMLRKSVDKHPSAVPSIQKRIQQDFIDLVLSIGKTKTDMVFLYERQGDYNNAIETCTEVKALYKKQKKRSQNQQSIPTAQTGFSSVDDDDVISVASGSTTSKGSKSHGSKSSSDSDRSITWYVTCTDIDFRIRTTSILLARLTKAKASFEDRKKLAEEILILRQEIAATAEPVERAKLYKKCEKMIKVAIEMERSCLGDTHPQVADTLQLLSAVYLEQQHVKPGYRDAAIQYMLQGLDINMKTLGSKHPRTGQDMLRMARLYQQSGPPTVSNTNTAMIRKNEDRAIEYFRQAATIFRGVKCGNKVVGSILNDLSVLYVARREFQTALDLLHESLSMYEGDSDDASTASNEENSCSLHNICIEVVQVWRNIGECHLQLTDFQKAIEAYINALDVQRNARLKYDSVSESDDLDSLSEEKSYLFHLMRMINDESIADTLRRLGKAIAATGKLQEALVVYRESAQIYRSSVEEALVFAKFGNNPELAGKQDQLASTLFCIAELYTMASKFDDAVIVFNESLQLRKSSDNSRHENHRCNMVHCAMCLVGIANVHSLKGEHLDAHKLYTDALHYCEAQGIPFNHAIVSMIEQRRKESEKKIIDDPKGTMEIARLEQKAEIERINGNYEQAISTLSELMTLRIARTENLKSIMHDTSFEIEATVKLLRTFGAVFAEMGDDEKSKRAFKDASRLQRKGMSLPTKTVQDK